MFVIFDLVIFDLFVFAFLWFLDLTLVLVCCAAGCVGFVILVWFCCAWDSWFAYVLNDC